MKKEKDTQLEFDFRSDAEIALAEEAKKKVEEKLCEKWYSVWGFMPTYTITTYASTSGTSSSYIYATNTTTV